MKQNNLFYSMMLFISILLIQTDAVSARELNCDEPDDYTHITYFLVDRSDQLKSTNGLKRTFSITNKDIIKNKAGERLIVGVITGKSAETRIHMDRVKPENSLYESAIKLRKKRNLFNSCIKRESNNLAKPGESHRTSAILETLKFVSEVLRKDGAKRKRLIIYSDMVQNSRALSFYGKRVKLYGKPTTKSPDKIVAALEKSLISDFKNVDVFIAGTGGTVSDSRARIVEQFWRAYFKKTGAKLQFYGPLLTGLRTAAK